MDEDVMSQGEMSDIMCNDPLSFEMSDSEEDLSSENMDTYESYQVLEVCQPYVLKNDI